MLSCIVSSIIIDLCFFQSIVNISSSFFFIIINYFLSLFIRGLKAKIESLKEIIIDEHPEIVGLVETMLNTGDAIPLGGYTVFRNDRNSDGGAVVMAVHNDLKGLIVEECKESEEGETLWLCMGRTEFSVRI